MKSFDRNDPIQAKHYRQVKALSRLLIKRQDTLVYDKWTKWRNFGWAYLTESEVVERLLSTSDELRIAYAYYQEILQAFYDKACKNNAQVGSKRTASYKKSVYKL